LMVRRWPQMSAPRGPRDSGCYHREPAPEHDVACAHALGDELSKPGIVWALAASGGTMVSLIQSRPTVTRHGIERCASLSTFSNWVDVEISVERDRNGGRMLPLARFQEGLLNKRRDFGLAHLDVRHKSPRLRRSR